MPDKLNELQAKWDAWNKENVAPLWGGGGGEGGEGKAKKARKGKAEVKSRLPGGRHRKGVNDGEDRG